MSIKGELERFKQERDALEAVEKSDRAKKTDARNAQAARLKDYQRSREAELGSLGVMTRLEEYRIQFDYKDVSITVDPGIDDYSVTSGRDKSGSSIKESIPGSKRTIKNPEELDVYLAEIIDRSGRGKLL